jgi:hypothetical protein
MTFGTFVRQLFEGDFGVKISEATILSVCLANDLTEDTEVTSENYRQAMIAIIREVPTLLLYPEYVGETGAVYHWRRRSSGDEIMEWYKLRCKEYGLDNVLKARITFL